MLTMKEAKKRATVMDKDVSVTLSARELKYLTERMRRMVFADAELHCDPFVEKLWKKLRGQMPDGMA